MELLFNTNAYKKSCEASITAIDEKGIYLDRTIFYPTGGGQPGDSGSLTAVDGRTSIILEARKGITPYGVAHISNEEKQLLKVGDSVTANIDWERRHRFMRMHSCMHLLSAIIRYPITGGQVGDGKGRVDFDIDGDLPGKEVITIQLNRLIEQNYPITSEWITDEELRVQPELIKTMSVKPPTGTGHVRLIRVEGVDLQPCGGTHVSQTGEIGRVEVRKIQNKGKQNRRVSISLLS